MLLMYEYFKQEKLYRFEPYTANWGKKKGNKKKKIKFQSSSKSVANYKITLSYTK
jgi:hypothetical protein